MEGTVKAIVLERGYGFIVVPGRVKDVFFHLTSLADPDLEFNEQLRERRVEFDIETDRRSGKERAANVRAAD